MRKGPDNKETNLEKVNFTKSHTIVLHFFQATCFFLTSLMNTFVSLIVNGSFQVRTRTEGRKLKMRELSFVCQAQMCFPAVKHQGVPQQGSRAQCDSLVSIATSHSLWQLQTGADKHPGSSINQREITEQHTQSCSTQGHSKCHVILCVISIHVFQLQIQSKCLIELLLYK